MPSSALSYLGPVRTNVRRVAEEVVREAEEAGHRINVIWGYNAASKPEHSAGTALDFMCSRAAGDWISAYLWRHRSRLGLRWQIWRQRIQSTSPGKGAGWRRMADRGGVTANHMDHVHANFFVKAYTGPTGGGSKPAPKGKHPVDVGNINLVRSGKWKTSESVAFLQEQLVRLLGKDSDGLDVTGRWGPLTQRVYDRARDRLFPDWPTGDRRGGAGTTSVAAIVKKAGGFSGDRRVIA